MKLTDYLQRMNGELYLVKFQDKVYILSDYRLEDKNYDYGIYASVSYNELLNGTCSDADVVPEMFIDDFFDFMINDDLSDTYGVSEEDLDQLVNVDYQNWSKELTNKGYKVPDYFTEICNILNGDAFDPEEIQNEGSETDRECIKKYIRITEGKAITLEKLKQWIEDGLEITDLPKDYVTIMRDSTEFDLFDIYINGKKKYIHLNEEEATDAIICLFDGIEIGQNVSKSFN